VLRDGVAVEIDSTAVVPGDAVLLAAGSLIPAVTIYPASGIEPTVPDG
jgi:magnesium-transporting ATPase (P-type)